jgi:trimeric autotransporter adhesin
MATYVNDLRLKEITTGDESGTWGTSTNTNLELIAEAFSYGTEVITTNADTHTTTIADGSTDPGRSLYLKYTGTLDSACTITIGPDTVSKVWIIENGTSGSQDIILSQGSGANITIPAGDTKVVYSDGAGAGAAFVDAFASLNVGALTATTVNDIASKAFGTSSIMIGDTTTGTISAADYNTGVGVNVFEDLTSGDNNSAFGFNALTNITTGSDNTAIGRTTLVSTTTGSNNTAVGSIALNVNTGDNNTAVGKSALAANTTASYNTAVGTSALTTNTEGARNVALGYAALYANTTGLYNVGIGFEALDANTTANSNTAIGYNAMGVNTTGASNVAIGFNALDSNTTASNNTAVGYDALTANTTGTENVAVGSLALDANTEGPYNTAVGHGSLGANVTGSQNAAFGYLALAANTSLKNTAVGAYAQYQSTSAQESTAVGYGALSALTSGSYNTAVGVSALGLNTTGYNNTAVGYQALLANTEGPYNVAVGFEALYSNTVASGNTSLGKGSLKVHESGNYNTAVGYGSLESSTTGNNNCAVGTNSGYNITTGEFNQFIGRDCRGTAVGQAGANGFGHDIQAEGGYTTVGRSTNDIRAAHGVATWLTVSDERYKKDIVDSTAGLSFINALQPRTFKYKTLGELPETFRAYEAGSTEVFKNSNTNHGFIAQEVKAAIDADDSIKDGFKLWDDRDDGSQEVAEAALIPILVKALQEADAKIEALTTRIEALEG